VAPLVDSGQPAASRRGRCYHGQCLVHEGPIQGVGWDGGSLEQAHDGGGLGRQKVNGGGADGRSSATAWTLEGNNGHAWFSRGVVVLLEEGRAWWLMV
jgi:hypothetical protein